MNAYLSYQDYEELNYYIENIYEGKISDGFKTAFSNITKDVKANFKFIGTFGMVIALFFPLADNLITNLKFDIELTPTNIVLATIGALGTIIMNNSSKIKTVMALLKDKKWEIVIEKLAGAFNGLFAIFKFLADQAGVVIRYFADMMGYTLMLVPFLRVILEFTEKNTLKPDHLEGLILSAGSGLAVIAGKNIYDVLKTEIMKKNSKIKFDDA